MRSSIFIGLFLLVSVFISGCTSFNGITKAEEPGSYYVITNTKKFIGTRPGVLLCTPDEDGNLNCRRVTCKTR